MHNLRRVAAGLRGEYLEPEATPEPEEGADAVADGVGSTNKKKGGKKGKASEEQEWQDIAEYEASQGGIEVGDVGERSNAVQDGGEAPEIEATGGKRKGDTDTEGGKLDKEARKKAKKARDAERKKENEKKRVENAA